MTSHGHLLEIDPDECRRLLGGTGVGRVAWASRDGLQILPVSYVFDGAAIAFRTSVGSALSELTSPAEVAFQVDDLDTETATGWSVLVQGTSGPGEEALATRALPWAPGSRPVTIGVTPRSFAGRWVSADH